jgi:hypothetical protein
MARDVFISSHCRHCFMSDTTEVMMYSEGVTCWAQDEEDDE